MKTSWQLPVDTTCRQHLKRLLLTRSILFRLRSFIHLRSNELQKASRIMVTFRQNWRKKIVFKRANLMFRRIKLCKKLFKLFSQQSNMYAACNGWGLFLNYVKELAVVCNTLKLLFTLNDSEAYFFTTSLPLSRLFTPKISRAHSIVLSFTIQCSIQWTCCIIRTRDESKLEWNDG